MSRERIFEDLSDLGKLYGSLYGADTPFTQDDSFPQTDPTREAQRLARQWRRLATRMQELGW